MKEEQATIKLHTNVQNTYNTYNSPNNLKKLQI